MDPPTQVVHFLSLGAAMVIFVLGYLSCQFSLISNSFCNLFSIFSNIVLPPLNTIFSHKTFLSSREKLFVVLSIICYKLRCYFPKVFGENKHSGHLINRELRDIFIPSGNSYHLPFEESFLNSYNSFSQLSDK